MTTVTFQTVLAAILARGDNSSVSDVASFATEKKARIDSAINEAYHEAFKYNAGGWPETVSVDEFTPEDQAVTDYKWTPYDEDTNLVSDAIFDVYDADPRLGQAATVDFSRGADGIYYSTVSGRTPPTTVWIRWRIAEGRFACGAYSGATAYVVDDVVRYTDGHCYRCIQAVTGTAPGNTAYWTRQDFMALLEKPVINGACAILRQNLTEFDHSAVLLAAMRDQLDEECYDLAAKGYFNYPRR